MKLEYCPVDSVSSFTRVTASGKLITPIVLIPGANWLELPKVDLAKRDYDISMTETKQGTIHNSSINGFLDGLTATNMATIEKMLDVKFVVKMTTSRAVFLMATPEFPAEFKYKAIGGGAGNELSKITFQFVAKLPHAIFEL